LKKWNRVPIKYGDTWQTGDAIGTYIDLDNGTIGFSRNGKDLGVAFRDVKRGHGIAYFPAVSLSLNESLVANFGATPLHFPLPGTEKSRSVRELVPLYLIGWAGYNPIQQQRRGDMMKANLLFSWLEKLLSLFPESNFQGTDVANRPKELWILAHQIFEHLGPFFQSEFGIEEAYHKFLSRVLGLPETVGIHDAFHQPQALHYEKLNLFLDMAWTFMEVMTNY